MSEPRVSIVVITRDEAPRLRLALESLRCQELLPNEVVIVDDGSRDGTAAVVSEYEAALPIRLRRNPSSQGRSAARNAGAEAAGGEVVVFLDGDVLAAPELVRRHAEAHRGSRVAGRGETHHLRSTRFFLDPEVGSPMPGQEDRVARMGRSFASQLVTRDQIRARFETIAAKGEAGIYPGAGPRRLYEIEMAGLAAVPPLGVAWMAASGHNFSVRRDDLRRVGGYDERLTINEHRELALRLAQLGVPVVPVRGARSFHMTHRSGWRDPVEDDVGWERVFHEKHPHASVRLMAVFWQSLAGDPHIPEASRIRDLEQLDRIVREGSAVDYDAIRRQHPRLRHLEV